MRLSCIPVSFFKDIYAGRMTLGQFASLAHRLGLDAIDLTVAFFRGKTSGEIEAIQREIRQANMDVAMLVAYPDLTHPDATVRQTEIRQLEEDIALAARLGASHVRVTAGQAHPATTLEQGVNWVVEGFDSVLSQAQAEGIVLAFENHSKPSVWEQYDFAYPPDVFIEIARRMAGSSLGILFDMANALVYGVDPLPVLEAVVNQVCCVHAADISERGKLSHTVIGTGIVPFGKLFACLKEAGFDGLISIEEVSGRGEAGLEQAVRFVRQAWLEA